METLIDKFNWIAYGVDEFMIPSLQATDAVGLPGGFTYYCLVNGRGGIDSLTR